MPKIRRGGYIFFIWQSDHAPRHVHVYRDGKLIVKWDLDNHRPMKGKATGGFSSSSRNSNLRVCYED